MSRGLLLCSAAFVAVALVASAVAAKDDKPKKDAAQVKREKNLVDIATTFQGKGVSALVGRVAKEQKISLTLDGKEQDYSGTQASSVLQRYFDGLERIVVTTTNDDKARPVKMEGSAGTFPVSLTKKGADKAKDGTLGLTLGDLGADDKYTLRKLSVVEK